jgi:hypothetical protein
LKPSIEGGLVVLVVFERRQSSALEHDASFFFSPLELPIDAR